ncbi:solute carrier family 46 member 3-like [Mercenaria mercenaria]|uniref:solute carrier family 46 member 3-like n=1 Tax=Mercenaria mercenaria TaxID=6596 RepID=UPI00234F2384|nr:solute carrier family 46 member 3-like [Mercenaria mercenaria]
MDGKEKSIVPDSAGKRRKDNSSSDLEISEREPLIATEDDDIGYRKYHRLEIDRTWRHLLIGPVLFVYIFAMICSYYALVEYTKEYFREIEYEEANLSLGNDSYDRCNADEDDIIYKTETKATSTAANWNLYYAVAAGVPSIISNMILGSYTDALGRKFLLAIGIAGSCLRLGIAAITIHFDANIAYLLIACFVEGCTGQYATALQASFAYAADITKPGRSRILGIVVIEFCLGVGMSSASFVEGYLVEWKGYMVTFSAMAIILVFTFLFMVFLLPETLTKAHRRRDKSCVDLLKISSSLFINNDSENRRWKYQIVILMHALVNISFHARLPTETLYQLAPPFCWSITKVGVYAAVRTLAYMCIGLTSVRIFQLCLDEVWICMIGTVSYTAAFFWTAFVTDDIAYYSIIAVGCFGPLSVTMHRSILSHLTPPEKQGAIFSAIGTQEVVSHLLSNVITSSVYAETVSYMRGLVFLVLGGFDAVSIILTLFLKIGWYREKKADKGQSTSQTEIIVSVPASEQEV